MTHRAVIIKAIDTPFQWITTSVEEATDFTMHMEKNGYIIHTDPDMIWPEKLPSIQEAYSLDMLDKIRNILQDAIYKSFPLES